MTRDDTGGAVAKATMTAWRTGDHDPAKRRALDKYVEQGLQFGA